MESLQITGIWPNICYSGVAVNGSAQYESTLFERQGRWTIPIFGTAQTSSGASNRDESKELNGPRRKRAYIPLSYRSILEFAILSLLAKNWKRVGPERPSDQDSGPDAPR